MKRYLAAVIIMLTLGQAYASQILGGVPTPAYLSVQDFNQCMSKQKLNTQTSWCMPAFKPLQCPTASWDKLQTMDLPVCQTTVPVNQTGIDKQ